ncbi:MAG: hypothetical protein ACHQ4J_13090 [Candidatus Binatia bacterium]
MVRKLFFICETIRVTLTVRWHLSAIPAFAALITPGMAGATTIIVDSAGSGQATGIQVGISLATTGDTVRVLSGTTGVYNEAVVLNQDIALECEGPDLVNIHNNSGDTITINTNRTVTIRGCTITGAGAGIIIGQSANADIANNVLWGNAKGISRHLPTTGNTLTVPIGTVVIRNNVITGSSGKGIDLPTPNNFNTNCANPGDVSKVVINNIIYNNVQCGADLCTTSGGVLDVEYNDSIGNTPNYCDNTNAGPGALSVAPGFMNEVTGDFRLSVSSTIRNSGKPGYNDPDGTRNDLGAYGGPDSADFFPSPEGGPTIRTMSLSPSSVPKNGTVTLQATGQVAVP